MKREVAAVLDLQSGGPARIALAIAAVGAGDERFDAVQAGVALPVRVFDDAHSGRVHILEVGSGSVHVEYAATIDEATSVSPADPLEELRYLRPSRYAESDILRPIAVSEFSGLRGPELLAGVAAWVADRVAYVPGSSLPTDGAVRTLLSRRGVCRDFAHLVVGFLRALDVPARMASVYAPGLAPMDFHAVAEGFVDGWWQVIDATMLAPRESLARIATGRDAADIAFLSARGDRPVTISGMTVRAIADGLPRDDFRHPVALV